MSNTWPRKIARQTYCLLAVTAATGCIIPYNARSGEFVADTSATYRQLLNAVQADQRAFEEWRHRNLPLRFGRTPRQRCQEPLGRFCLEGGTGYGAWVHLPVNPEIAREREELIGALQDVAHRIPDDDWVVGQVVRYTVEAGRMSDAMAAARDCVATPWWCAALLAYVNHRRGDAAGAHQLFDAALKAMPEGERERWTDPRPLLEPEGAALYTQLNEVSKAAFVYQLWRLSDPFMTRPGNEILTEHFARRVDLLFRVGAAGSFEGLDWGPDLEDALLRYGPTAEWIRALGAEFELLGRRYYMGPPRWVPDLIGRYTTAGSDLLPPAGFFLTGEGTWDPIQDVPRTGYDIAVGDSAATWLVPLAHQVAVFPREEESAIVAAFDLPSHGFLGVAGGEGALAIVPTDDLLGQPEVEPARVAGGVGVVLRQTRSRPIVISLEAFLPERHIVGRSRLRMEPRVLAPGQRAMSDILFLRSSGPLPETLEEAVEKARGSNRVSPGEEVVIFWEMYGLDLVADSAVTMSLRFVPGESTGLRRFGEIIGVVGERSFAEIRWREEVNGESVMPRAVALVIPELRDGTHGVELTMHAGGDSIVTRADVIVGHGPVEPVQSRSVTRRPQLVRLLCGSRSDLSKIVGNEGNVAAFEPYHDFADQAFYNNTLEPPPCPRYIYDVLYETGHGY